MSTKMSTDLNITRPSSRVLRAPGGGSSFSIGGDFYGEEPVKNTRKNLSTSTFSLGAETEVPTVNKGIRHIQGKSTFTIGHVEPAPTVNENVNSAANRRRNAGEEEDVEMREEGSLVSVKVERLVYEQYSFIAVRMRIAIVSGANKGIGFEISKKLCASGLKTILACRNEALGTKAMNDLRRLGYDSEYRHLDIADEDSIARFVDSIARDYGKVDILVNNAAIAFKGSDPTPFRDQAHPTIKPNFFGTLLLSMSLLPLLRRGDSPRLVTLASEAGHLRILQTRQLMESFSSDALTVPQLQGLMNSFVAAVQDGSHSRFGWPNTCYGMSKLGVVAMTRVLAREEREIPGSKVVISCCCPGWCATDMSSNRGSKTAEQGAITPVMLALLPEASDAGGKFFANGREIEW